MSSCGFFRRSALLTSLLPIISVPTSAQSSGSPGLTFLHISTCPPFFFLCHKLCAKSFWLGLFATLFTVAYQASLSVGIF